MPSCRMVMERVEKPEESVSDFMTYDEYIAQQQQAMDEEQQEDSCFLEYQPEGQFVRGH